MKLTHFFMAGAFLGSPLLAWSSDAPTVPTSLKTPAGSVLELATNAKGVQIYECSVDKDNASIYSWSLKAPEAELFNMQGVKVAKHYGGPTWEGLDGSKVVGKLKASDKGPDSNAIAWLLLDAKSNSGNGTFGKTSAIQRINTSGGKAPADGCDKAHAGSTTRVPYTAQYYFYDASASGY